MTDDQKLLGSIARELLGMPLAQLTKAEKNIFELLYKAEILCTMGEEIAWYDKATEIARLASNPSRWVNPFAPGK